MRQQRATSSPLPPEALSGTVIGVDGVRFVTSGSARLAYEESGSGPDVVFLHAGVADRRSWSPMTALLPDFRTLAYDRRGFGATTAEPEEHSWVGDLVAVLDAAGIERCVLVGNSQGGRIAIDAALAHPGRVRALVLIAPAVSGAPEPPEHPPSVQALGHAIDIAEAAGDIDAVNRLEARLWLDGPESDEGRVGGALRSLFLDMNGIALRAAPSGPAIPAPPAWPRLGDLRVPTLAVVGDLDLPHLRGRCEAIVGDRPEARLAVLPGVAHLPQMEDPARCADLVREFLQGLPD